MAMVLVFCHGPGEDGYVERSEPDVAARSRALFEQLRAERVRQEAASDADPASEAASDGPESGRFPQSEELQTDDPERAAAVPEESTAADPRPLESGEDDHRQALAGVDDRAHGFSDLPVDGQGADAALSQSPPSLPAQHEEPGAALGPHFAASDSGESVADDAGDRSVMSAAVPTVAELVTAAAQAGAEGGATGAFPPKAGSPSAPQDSDMPGAFPPNAQGLPMTSLVVEPAPGAPECSEESAETDPGANPVVADYPTSGDGALSAPDEMAAPAFHVEPRHGGAGDEKAPAFHVEHGASEQATSHDSAEAPPTVVHPTPNSPTLATSAPARPVTAPAARPRHPAAALPLPRIIAVANQKGGVGKTTTAVNLGAALAELGYRTLVVDLDPQGNATTGLGVNARNLDSSIYDVLMHEMPIEDCVEPTSVRNLFVAPATIDLAGAEIELVPAFSREMRLKRALAEVSDAYEFTIIDCPPSLGLLTVNGLAAATEVIVPIQCEYYALEGLSQLMRNVNLVQSNLNPTLLLSAIVLTMYDARTKLAEQVANEVREHFGERVCRNVVPRTVRLSEAPSFGQPIIVFDPSSRGALSYRELAKEVSGGAPQRVG